MRTTLAAALIVLALTNLTGCEQAKIEETVVEQDSSGPKKLALFGVDISTATKTSITKALSNENLWFIRRINKWEEVWSAGNVLKEASQIKIGFTEEGNLAYFQYDFPSQSDPDQVLRVQKQAEEQYGKPSSVDGEAASGEYEATWDMGDGLRVSVRRGFPETTSHLTYFNDAIFDTLKLEYDIEAKRQKEMAR